MPDYSLTPSRATWRDRAVLVLLALYWLALVLGTHTPTTPRTTGLPMSAARTLQRRPSPTYTTVGQADCTKRPRYGRAIKLDSGAPSLNE